MRTSVAERDAALLGLGVSVNGGVVRFYNGTKPANPDTALSGNTLIVQCNLGNPAYVTPSGGFMALASIAAGVIAASGTPTFARFFRNGGLVAVVDMDVPGEIQLSKDAWVLGEPFAGPSVTWSLPVGP